MAIIERTPGNIPSVIEKLISCFLPLNLMHEKAYAVIMTKIDEIRQVKIPMIIEFLNHAGKFATVSGWNRSFL